MIVYRISHERYARQLNSSGAANRWNRAFQYVIYCSESISLCALELLAHSNGIKPAGVFKVMEIEISEAASMEEIKLNQLPEDWHMLSSYARTQSIGAHWYDEKSSLCLKVPSAIIQSEFNIIINVGHPGFDEFVKLIRVRDFFWDSRFPEN